MKALVIYCTRTGNTEKIARAVARGLGCRAKKVSEANATEVAGCGLVGFGTGIYYFRPAKEILDFIARLDGRGKRAFVFATHDGKGGGAFSRLRKAVAAQGYAVVGDYICLGRDMFFPFRLVGGILKGHPTAKELAGAEAFGSLILPYE